MNPQHLLKLRAELRALRPGPACHRVRAGKAAGLLSILAAVLVIVAFPRVAIRELAENELTVVRRALGVWTVYEPHFARTRVDAVSAP